LIQEERLDQNQAADLVRLDIDRSTSVATDAVHHFLEGRRAVLLAEGVPRPADRHRLVLHEEATTHDPAAAWAVELEEEQLPRFERRRPPACARLPEVHFGELGLRRQETEPVVVGDAKPIPHSPLSSVR
jgi:hypothetical protein